MGKVEERLGACFRLQSLSLVGHPILGNINLKFCQDYYIGQRVYTSVVIGANGIGKSHLLRTIAEIFCCLESLKKDAEISIPRYYFNVVYSSHWQKYEFANFREINPASKQRRFTNFVFKREGEDVDSHQMELPTRVIASSTTINDKFVAKSTDMYRYKGLRSENNPSSTGTRTMVRKTVESLLDSLDEKYGFRTELRNLLEDLKLQPRLELSYNLRYKEVFVKDGMTTGELIYIFENQKGRFKRETDIWGTKNFKKIKENEPWKLDAAANLLNRLSQQGYGKGRQLLKYELLDGDPRVSEDREGLKALTALDLLSYPTLKVYKQKDEYTFDQSSSGESSLLCQMVGIMSDIEPNSLVLIDEPENSAHPNWQISYIDWLKNIFLPYSNCHFVISTHSHFMLTDLEPESSDIVALEKKDGIVRDVSEGVNTFNWSVDDILYRVFGVRNTRNRAFEDEIMELCKMMSDGSRDMDKIKRMREGLSKVILPGSDPLLEILNQAEKYVEVESEKPYRFTKDEWQHVSRVLIPYIKSHDGEKGWVKGDNKTKDLKNRISEYTLLQQNQCCAYCEEFMVAGIQLDHIVPKQLHPEYCYEPKNLVSCCAVCNLYIKNADDTVVVPLKHRYEQNEFKIVHPYFNDPDVHIKYTNEDRVIVDRKGSTKLGKATIDFFEMDKYPATCKRAMRFGALKKYPIDFIRLAKECSAYKR